MNAGSTSLKVVMVEDGRAKFLDGLDAAVAGTAPDAVVHRVVHGGDRTEAALVDAALVAELAALGDRAPLHQPPALGALARCRSAWPAVPHVACFDTAFHTTIPEAARTYALPARLRSKVRLHGFHGLAHAWAVRRTASLAPEARRVVVAHLGGGQSLCAALDGRSIATTMGFSTLDGLVMATRCGSLDPGAVLWLQRHTDEDLDTVLAEESGLVGLCGESDLRAVRRRAEGGDADAVLALDVWLHRAVTLVGSCVAALGGIDALVFSGGIGEHDPDARAAIVDRLSFLGAAIRDDLDLDHDLDVAGDAEITAAGSSVRTFVVSSREDLELAGQAAALLDMGVPAGRGQSGQPPGGSS